MVETSRWSDVGSLLTELVCLLVDRPEAVRVQELQGSQSTVLEVSVARSDFGKLIGKHGSRAAAIRQLLVATSGALDRRFLLEILEPDERGASQPPGQPRPVDDADPLETTTRVLQKLVELLVDHPEQVKVSSLPGSQVVVYEVAVAEEDVPRLIGNGGRTATAIRELLVAVSGKLKRRLILDISEPSSRHQVRRSSEQRGSRRGRRVWEPPPPHQEVMDRPASSETDSGETNRAA